jgi:tRNA threonylcarbamoyladenosine biosynthesis protein TsaB
MSEPLLLALDTSTSIASVALFDGQQVISETTWRAGREHSTRLLVEVEIALERVGRTHEQLSGLAVARGPGSFTGVRVALSVAKGIAGGFGVPAWGVNSLDALAFSVGPTSLPVRAVLEAGRGRFATALYRTADAVEGPRLVTLEELITLIEEETMVVGELSPEARSRLDELPRIRLGPRAAGVRRAGFVAELAWQMAQRGDPGDLRLLDAIYLT